MEGSNQNQQNQNSKPQGRGRGYKPGRAMRGQNIQWRGNMTADFRPKTKTLTQQDQHIEPQPETQQSSAPIGAEETNGRKFHRIDINFVIYKNQVLKISVYIHTCEKICRY